MSIAEFSIKNRLIMFIVIIGSMLGGWYAYENMGRFEDPEFTIRTAVVATQYPGASPEEVAREVTDPLETAIQQLQEVTRSVRYRPTDCRSSMSTSNTNSLRTRRACNCSGPSFATRWRTHHLNCHLVRRRHP